ncbi:MAG: DNA repair protein RadC [Myxococcales bacterium]|nr:DNA repair protein RadC [Myxococcales bacterium]
MSFDRSHHPCMLGEVRTAEGTASEGVALRGTDGPRERLLTHGARTLSDAELVAVLLGTGRRGEPVEVLAARLVAQVGGPHGLSNTGAGTLAAIEGVGEAKAARLLAALELGARAMRPALVRGCAFGSSRDVHACYGPALGRERLEWFVAVALDARNRVLAEMRSGPAGPAGCPVSPGDVMRMLLREAAAGALFVHNHPSGEPDPSAEDAELTRRLVEAGRLLGVRVIDHVIVTADRWFSFADAGLLGTPTDRR